MKYAIATFLRRIPQSNQDAVALTELADDNVFWQGYTSVLATLGMIELDGNKIRARSQTAKYALNSLAEFVENELEVVSDWKTRGIDKNPLDNGATLLRWLEEKRLSLTPDARPSREEKVAQVIIKRLNPVSQKPEILFQFDHNANQYQLIGGRYSPRDNQSLLNTMIREITEELPNNSLDYGVHYELTCLIDDLSPEPTISLTFGALTRYHFSIFHMTNVHHPIVLGQNDQWLPIEDVLNNSHATSTNAIYQRIDDAIPGGLYSLKYSFG